MSLLVNYGSFPPSTSGAVELEARLWEMDPRLQLSTSPGSTPRKRHPNGDPHHRANGTRSGATARTEKTHDRPLADGGVRHDLLDMVVMAAGAAGRITGVEDRIDAHNASWSVTTPGRPRATWARAMDHAVRLFPRPHPAEERPFVGWPGLRDSKPPR